MQNKMLYGVVESVDDPEQLGRVKVRFFNEHSQNLLDTSLEQLNWCHTMMPNTGSSMSGLGETHQLKNGAYVIAVSFDEYLEECFILGSIKGKHKEMPSLEIGFSDPKGDFPIKDRLNESDENRLSRNSNIENTIVQKKIDGLTKNIKRANDIPSYNEPDVPYNAKYPYNAVTETEAGHIFEVDNTQGAERIHEYHKSGTFKEIHPSGDKVVKIEGDDFKIVKGDGHILVQGLHSVTATNMSIKIEGDIELEVEGSINAVIHNDLKAKVMKNVELEVEGDYIETILGDYTQVVEGDIKTTGKTIESIAINGHKIKGKRIDLN